MVGCEGCETRLGCSHQRLAGTANLGMLVPAIQAGKDIYQEKTMAFNPDHAKRMRKTLGGSGRVVQVGIRAPSPKGRPPGCAGEAAEV